MIEITDTPPRNWKASHPPAAGWVRMDLTLKRGAALTAEEINGLCTSSGFTAEGVAWQRGNKLTVLCKSSPKAAA